MKFRDKRIEGMNACGCSIAYLKQKIKHCPQRDIPHFK